LVPPKDAVPQVSSSASLAPVPETVVVPTPAAPSYAPPPVLPEEPSAATLAAAPASPVVAPEHTLKLPEPVATPMATAPQSQEKVINGFANKVPLAVALRQILPSNYGFSVDRDVTLSTQVSWRGGKPWRDVMSSMLASAGLGMKDDGGQMIRIVRDVSASSASTEAAAPSLAPLPEAKNVPDHTLQLPSGMTATPMVVTEATPAAVPSPAAPAFVEDPTPPAPLPVADSWTASRGDMLRATLEEWAKRAHVEFVWKSEYDYPVQATVSVSGSFEDAVRNILSGFQEAQPQPVARLYTNKTIGQSALVVEARGNNFGN
jgi:hypothetical protein